MPIMPKSEGQFLAGLRDEQAILALAVIFGPAATVRIIDMKIHYRGRTEKG